MFEKITRQSLETFLSKYASEERVLDIGAGGSAYGKMFPNRVSFDIDPARKPDIVGDAHHMPFSDGEFGMIVCTEVLEHLKDPPRAITEMWRVLKPGGTLLLTTRFVYPIHDSPHDYWRFTKYGLRELFREWDIRELQVETDTFGTVAVLIQRIAFQTRLRLNKPLKLILLILASLVRRSNWLITKEFGDIKKQTVEEGILSSGYYMVCIRR